MEAIQTLRHALADPSRPPSVHWAIARALGFAHDREVVGLLSEIARHSGALAKDALQTLAYIGGRDACSALGAMLAQTTDGHPRKART